MVRCRFCLDITSLGEPDNEHIDHERECMKEWDGNAEYYGLERITHKNSDYVRNYHKIVDEIIEENYPEYWEELKRFRNNV